MNFEKYAVKKDTAFLEIYYRFKHNNSRGILLVTDDDGCLTGIIGVKELSEIAGAENARTLTAADIENKDFTFIYNDDNSYSNALELFYENDFNNIPVLNGNGHIAKLFNRIDFYELRMMSYTFASGEDIVLAFVLRDTENIFYIDAGAFDPVYGSVTKHFYDNGAKGINIEPLYNQYKMLLKARPRDISINAVCSDTDGLDVDFYICYGSSTAVKEYALHGASAVKAESVSLRGVASKYLSLDQTVHFLKVDVEGFEKQVLEGMDFSRNRPWIIMLEATVPDTNIPTQDLWENILFENGYVFARQYGVNRFYADNTAGMADKLLPRFIDLEKIRHRLIMSEVNLNNVLLNI